MTPTPKQRAAIAAVVMLGLAGTAAVLWPDRQGDGRPDAGHPAAPHADHAEGAEAHASAGPAEAGPAGAGRVELDDAQIRAAGIRVEPVGPAPVRVAVPFPGEIRFDEDRTAHVVPRFSGVVESVAAQLGQRVRKGDLLAVVGSPALAEQRGDWQTARLRRDAARTAWEREKRLYEDRIAARQDFEQAESALREAEIALRAAGQKLAAAGADPAGGGTAGLARHELRAPFAGTVVEKHLSLGEAVKEDTAVFTLSDLDRVWAEFAVAPKDLATVRVGQRARVTSSALAGEVEGQVAYVGALLGEQTRTARARIALVNPGGAWRPGLHVTVSILGDAEPVALALPLEAVQTVDGQPTAFKAAPGGFVAVPLRLGRSDGRQVEVLGGLAAGERVATARSFVLKSELGKDSADHGH